MGIMEFLDTPIGTSGLDYGNIFYLIVIIALAIVIARIVTANIRRVLKDEIPKNDLEIILKVVYFGIIIVGVMIALPNIDWSGVLLAGGIAGVVLGFASQSVVSNLISGLFLTIERPIRIGDNINVADIYGTVEDIRILSTIIKTYDGIYTRMPNELVFTSTITNFVANPVRRFEYSIGIRYEDDAELAVSIIKEILRAHPFVLKTPGPSIFVDELGDNGVIIITRIWSPSKVWYDVKMELLWKIKVALEKGGIEIPFPQRTVWFAETSKPTVSHEIPSISGEEHEISSVNSWESEGAGNSEGGNSL